jgi:hypothetical protein
MPPTSASRATASHAGRGASGGPTSMDEAIRAGLTVSPVGSVVRLRCDRQVLDGR